MKGKDMDRLIKDIKGWDENIDNHYSLYDGEGQYSLLGRLAKQAGLSNRYLSKWTYLSTLVISRISDHYNMGPIEGPRVVFRLGYTVSKCKERGKIEEAKAECIEILRHRFLTTEGLVIAR